VYLPIDVVSDQGQYVVGKENVRLPVQEVIDIFLLEGKARMRAEQLPKQSRHTDDDVNIRKGPKKKKDGTERRDSLLLNDIKLSPSSNEKITKRKRKNKRPSMS
jgi:hypothetical protein